MTCLLDEIFAGIEPVNKRATCDTLDDALRLISLSDVIAVDVETTGLDQRRDKVRLIQLAGSPYSSVVVDVFRYPILPILMALKGKMIIAHNAIFELGWFWQAGMRNLPECICTMLMAQVLESGTGDSCSLEACMNRYLNKTINKELQKSDWSGNLTPEQIEYARNDAECLFRLFQELSRLIEEAKLAKIVDIELRSLPAFTWMSQTGVPIDSRLWTDLAVKTEKESKELSAKLDRIAPIKGQMGLFGESTELWNWDSPKQVKEAFEKAGIKCSMTVKEHEVESTADAVLATINHPLANTLRDYREKSTLVKMFGKSWLANVSDDGRIYPQWFQMGTDTGRTACKSPSGKGGQMQQMPRNSAYRECFRATPGKVIVKTDYSHLQMRIAAKFAKDKRLYEIFKENRDPHIETAQALLSKKEVTKGDRQIAKSANFALVFGASAEGLKIYAKTNYGITFTDSEAINHRANFFRAYPGLANWHSQIRQGKCTETRSHLGRRRLLGKWSTDNDRANSPVQADEADGIKTAFALLWERRNQCPNARPILFVHDELCFEVPQQEAEQCRTWMEAAMMEAMEPILYPIPCRVESKIVSSWGG